MQPMNHTNSTKQHTFRQQAFTTCTLLLLVSLLSGCGFALRGIDAPVLGGDYVKLNVENAAQHRSLVKHTTVKLMTLGAEVESAYNQLNQNSKPNTQVIHQDSYFLVSVGDITFNKVSLVGTLSEVQLKLNAKVIIQQGKSQPFVHSLQVLRTYQYNSATVNTRNQQEDQIIERMNQELAARIVRQLSLYKPSTAPN